MKRSVIKVVLSTALLTSMGFGSELVLSGAKVEFEKRLSLNKISSASIDGNIISVVIHTKKALTQSDKDRLFQNGVKALKYAGVNSFYIVIDSANIDVLESDLEFIDGIALLKPIHKISSELQDANINDEIKVKVILLKEMNIAEFKNLLDQKGVDYKDLKFSSDEAEMTLMGIDIQKVASIPYIKEITKYHKLGIIKPFSANISTTDLDIIQQTNTDDAWREDEGLDGLNVPVAIVDEGKVLKSHQEFKTGYISRVKDRVVNGSLSLHSTHVAGIVGAQGVDRYAKGIASSTQIYSLSFQDEYFASAMSRIYSKLGVLVSNHSYGFTDKVDLGVYNSDASREDSLVYSNPYINAFLAAGNDRAYSDYPDTGIIKGAANAKNVFTIGALDYNSNYAAYYSSTGPVRDYRIKPDLCVKGSSVYSTSSSGGYAYMTGTSMATPAATALATLVMQEYKNLTDCGEGRGCDMRHDLLKSILINTAIDKGIEGPDIYTGYGMIDLKAAIDTVKTLKNSYKMIRMDKIGRGAIKEYFFTQDQNGEFKATLSWIDPAGNSASSGKSLVNDLDIYLLNIDTNEKFYPYSLNKENIKAKALNDRKNDVDNIEKIEVKTLEAGRYKLVVDATNIQTSTQEYAIASSKAIFLDAGSGVALKSITPSDIETNNFAKVMMEAIY